MQYLKYIHFDPTLVYFKSPHNLKYIRIFSIQFSINFSSFFRIIET